MPNVLNNTKLSAVISNLLAKIAAPFTSQLEKELKEYYVYIINNNPKDSDAYNNLGVLNYEFGNYKQSLKDLSKAISINAQYHQHIHYFCSALCMYLGHIYYINHNFIKANLYYKEAVFQDHNNEEAAYSKAIVTKHLENKEYSHSKKTGKLNAKSFVHSNYFHKVILDFDYAQISNLRYKNLLAILAKDDRKLENVVYKIDYLYQKQYYRDVLKFSKQALKKYNYNQFLYYIACCLYHLNKLSESQDYFEKYLKLEPDNLQATYDYGYCLLVDKKYEKAQKILKKSLADMDDIEFAQFAYGLTYFFQQKFTQAKKYFLAAYKTASKKHDAYHENSSTQFYNRAYVYFLNKQDDLAINDLTKALDLNQKNTDALLQRAKIYLKKHNFNSAAQDLENLLKLQPLHEEATLLLAKTHEKLLAAVE